MKEFKATIALPGDDDVEPQALETALRYAINRVRKFPPDARFDWDAMRIGVDYEPKVISR